jgi:hypothetical protein
MTSVPSANATATSPAMSWATRWAAGVPPTVTRIRLTAVANVKPRRAGVERRVLRAGDDPFRRQGDDLRRRNVDW